MIYIDEVSVHSTGGDFMNKLNGTHLTKYDRVKIQELLASNTNCKSIAAELNKDDRTISKEIKKRRVKEGNGRARFNPHDPASRSCPSLSRFPFVCNACLKRKSCSFDFKYFYRAIDAQDQYEFTLHDSRVGIDMQLSDKLQLDRILKDGIDKGQSVHHIIANHPQEIKCSSRTVYRMIDKDQTIVQNIDLRRKVRLKPRKHNKDVRKILPSSLRGRTYLDFLSFFGMNPGIGIVEIDTVQGIKGSNEKCLLTIHFTAFHFMIAFLIDHKTQDCVDSVFRELQLRLGPSNYQRLFPIILTDRGCEFFCPDVIEFDVRTGESLTHLFYCDSYSSYQKGAIEENHTLLRYILPKGTSFSSLTQDKVDLMISHINSFYRKSIQSCPYELMKAFYGSNLLDILKVKAIDPDLVTLKPILMK